MIGRGSQTSDNQRSGLENRSCRPIRRRILRLRPVELLTAGIEVARGSDLGWCHLARDIAHLLADVVVPGAGRERLELGVQIDRGLSFEPRSAGLAVDFAVAGPTGAMPRKGAPLATMRGGSPAAGRGVETRGR